MNKELIEAANKVSNFARGMRGRVSDADAVIQTLRAAVNNSSQNLNIFYRLVGNILCNFGQWGDSPLLELSKSLAINKTNRDFFFVPFANSGFCRFLRDDFNTDEGNLPHHMLSYFVMAYYLPRGIVMIGVWDHENKPNNPEKAGDTRSGNLAAEMSQLIDRNVWVNPYSFAAIPDYVRSKTVMPFCGHPECNK